MNKIPYEIISSKIDNLVLLMAVSPNYQSSLFWYKQYISFLNSCGWSPIDYDSETLSRVDDVWIKLHQQNCYIIWN